ncbi:NAD(P)-binding protein, partial [Allocoleopsis sp.]|uniref:NAD(P)-binding protein n=1 Tax=Allocoleopsis sp. TaxID=3088169 RepID=UPI002FCED4A8
MSESTKKKIVILGGGMASLVTAFELTSQPNWQDLYDITVYQLGWRLGGKGASGRNMTSHKSYAPDYRIQEHGFHIFFGFYENTFQVMKDCYDALADAPGTFQGIENAFQPHSFIVLEDQVKGGRWVPWKLHFPQTSMHPWPDGNDLQEEDTKASPWQYILKMLEFMLHTRSDSSYLDSLSYSDSELPTDSTPPHGWQCTAEGIKLEWEELSVKTDRELLELAHQFAQSLDEDIQCYSPEQRQCLISLLDKFMERAEGKLKKALEKLEEEFAHIIIDAIRTLIILNLGYAIIRGLLVNTILDWESFNDLDQRDFSAWLSANGAWTETVNSALVRAMYDLLLAFPGGIATPKTGRLGAAAALRWVWRMIFTYKGAVMWKMNAGMGDTIFVPFYKELKKRGVKFEFFHRVTNLALNSDRNAIAKIELGQQVTLKNPQQGYDPLISVNNLLCWPNEPLYEQIVQGQQLKDQHIDLESFWTSWQDVEQVTLNYQQDFDIVVLGISIGAFPFICQELINAKLEWQQMVKYVQTVTTQGGQLWLKDTLKKLGWNDDSPVLGTYVEPLDTYADMEHLIKQENWPSAHYPKDIAYFTGVMEDPGIPDPTDPNNQNFPAQQQQKINQQAIDWLNKNIGTLWPKAIIKDAQGTHLDWNLLVDLEDDQGQQRFYSQYWRVNI